MWSTDGCWSNRNTDLHRNGKYIIFILVFFSLQHCRKFGRVKRSGDWTVKQTRLWHITAHLKQSSMYVAKSLQVCEASNTPSRMWGRPRLSNKCCPSTCSLQRTSNYNQVEAAAGRVKTNTSHSINRTIQFGIQLLEVEICCSRYPALKWMSRYIPNAKSALSSFAHAPQLHSL